MQYMTENIVLGKFVSVAFDRPAHILERHGIKKSIADIVKLADLTKGQDGVHVFDEHDVSAKTIVIRGRYFENGKEYGIFRTMWYGGLGSNAELRNGLPIISHITPNPAVCEKHSLLPYVWGLCPFCDY